MKKYLYAENKKLGLINLTKLFKRKMPSRLTLKLLGYYNLHYRITEDG
tara:strand:- start:2507 stop:2650 length:144 start_codon:yes stop_codon:yes gene_type:complete